MTLRKAFFLPFKLPIEKIILIEDTFRVIRITLSKTKRSLCAIDMAEARHQMIKHHFLKIWQKLQIWERIKMKILNAIIFNEKHFILIPLKGQKTVFQYLVLFAPQN